MIANATETNITASQELALIRSATRGDRRSFEQLMQHHVPKVHRMLRRMLRNECDVEDVIQEALMKAFTHLCQFRGEARFGSWLHRIAANEAIQFHRNSRASRFIAIDDVERLIRDPLASSQERLEKIELCEQLNESVANLPPDSRAVVWLFHFEGLSVVETAQRLGLSEGGTKTRLARARARLGKMLDSSVARSRASRYDHH